MKRSLSTALVVTSSLALLAACSAGVSSLDFFADGGVDASASTEDASVRDGSVDARTSPPPLDAGADVVDASPTCDLTKSPAASPACVTETYGVFADATNGNDMTGDGSRAKPFATITAALAHAGTTARVYVCGGTYTEAVLMAGQDASFASPSGSIYGGFDCKTWKPGGPAVVVESTRGASLSIIDVRDSITVADISVVAPAGTLYIIPDSVAAIVAGSNDVRFDHVTFTAQTAFSQTEVVDGGANHMSFSNASDAKANLEGLGGGANCDNGTRSGGGYGGFYDTGTKKLLDGRFGTPDAGGGAGGASGVDCATASGAAGAHGATAPVTAAKLGTLYVQMGFGATGPLISAWNSSGVPFAVGTKGADGTIGQGGGGGGNGPGGIANTGWGGGGGYGGCGGAGGGGGYGGGGSIGLIVMSSKVAISGSTFAAGNGGNGSNGSDARAGQAGGAGSNAAAVGGPGGCPGGPGGHGAGGNGGSGGAAGVSFGVLFQGTPPTINGVAAKTSATFSGVTVGTAGTPGLPGAAGAAAVPGVSMPGAPGNMGPAAPPMAIQDYADL